MNTSTPPTYLPPLILAQLGQQLSSLALQLQQEPTLSAPGRVRLAELESLGLELQTLVHALGHGGLGGGETVPLLEALRATRRQWLPELARRGLRLQVDGQALSCVADPAQLQHGLDLLLAHGLAAGVDLALRLEAGAPGVAVIALSGAGDGPDAAEVHGQLLQWLTRSLPWRLERPAPVAGRWSLRLLLLPEPAAATEAEGLPRRHWSQQDRVLVIDADARTRTVAAALLRGAGLRGDCVATAAQADDALRDGLPSAVVCGYPLDEPGIEPLRARIERERPGLRWVELVAAPYVFAAGSADGRIPARISRHDLPHTLLASLAD